MDQEINYYELKTQLADLGFTEPHIADQLREAMLTECDYASLHADRDNVRFQINLDKDDLGELQFNTYDALLTDHNGQLRDQVFDYDVPVHEAIALLNDRLKRLDVTADIAGDPMSRQHVRVSLGLTPNEKNSHQLNFNFMNTQNLSYLQKQLLNLGFGEDMNKDLERNIESQAKEFTIGTTQTYNKQDVNYTLHYKAGDKDQMYFFNRYDASLKDNQQTFYINNGSGITAKEAYNLMEGRAVKKDLVNHENEKYRAWVVIDKDSQNTNGNHKLKTYSDGWNYKPEKAIDVMDIVAIKEPGAREKLMKSLEKGNRHQVTAMKNGKEVQLFIEANPAEHRVNLTNYKGEAQRIEDYKKPELKQEAKQENKQTEKKAEDGTKKKRTRQAKQTV